MIDERLLDAYVKELEALRSHGRDFAQAFPDIAGRLDIGSHRSRDPHVERVVESAAFLAARLGMMVEESTGELPMTVLSLLAPTLVEPIPSMAVLQLGDGSDEQAVPRGSRFDYEVSGQALACFATTMNVTARPTSLEVRRLDRPRGGVDGLGIRVRGMPPDDRLLLFVGSNRVNAAILLDAVDQHLERIDVVAPNGEVQRRLPPTALHVHGFDPEEAALPVRPATLPAHRVVAEYIVFPDKFRFISLATPELESGSEVQLVFSNMLELPEVLPQDLFRVNFVPAVNLWRAPAKPFELTGRQLEYPVRVDALRYRTVECHSVEAVDIYGADGAAERIDPVVAFGGGRATATRWATRRFFSRAGAEVTLLFQGIDFRRLGREAILAAPVVMASNRDIAPRTPTGEYLQPVGAVGDWRCSVSLPPTAYRPPLTATASMKALVGYLQSAMSSLAEGGANHLRDFLSRFPGAAEASWIRGIDAGAIRPVASVRGGNPSVGVVVALRFDQQSHRTTSTAIMRRVLGMLYESQRGLNQVQDVRVSAT